MESSSGLLLIIGSIVSFIFRNAGDPILIPTSYMMFVIIIWSIHETKMWFVVLREKSSKIIATNFASTTDRKCYQAGDYVLFTTGDIDHLLAIKSKEGAIIGPRDSVNVFGRHIVLAINPQLADFEELPLGIQRIIREIGIIGPYWFGLVSDRKSLSEPSASRLSEEIRHKGMLITDLSKTAQSKTDVGEKAISSAKRITGALSPKAGSGFFSSLRRRGPQDRDDKK